MLVESLPDGARLVLSGDPGGAVVGGPGPGVRGSAGRPGLPAGRLAHAGPRARSASWSPGIGIGELNQVEAPGKEVVIVPVRDAGEAVHRTVQLVADSVPRAIGVPAEQTQVITPGHGGAAGTRALNAALKERLNPGPGRFGGFDPGDRVGLRPGAGPDAARHRWSRRTPRACTWTARARPSSYRRSGWSRPCGTAGRSPRTRRSGMRWPAAVVVLPGRRGAGADPALGLHGVRPGERHLSVVHGVDQALPRAVAEVPPKTAPPGCGPAAQSARRGERRRPASGRSPAATGAAPRPARCAAGRPASSAVRRLRPSSSGVGLRQPRRRRRPQSSSSSSSLVEDRADVEAADDRCGSAWSKGALSHSPGSAGSSAADTHSVESPSSRPNSLCREAISSGSNSPKSTPSAACTLCRRRRRRPRVRRRGPVGDALGLREQPLRLRRPRSRGGSAR